MERRRLTYNYISDYLIEVQSKGRFSITLEELRRKFNVSEKALLQNVYRLKKKNLIAQVRKEFYIVIPPQYSNKGMVPPVLFIDDMMKFLERDYYVGLLSAAALHGASHQQPMEFYVIIKKPALRKIKNGKLIINFFVKNNWDASQIVAKKTDAGYLKVSSSELTAFDLIHYHNKIGGLNRIIPILEELAEEMKPSLLAKVAKNQKTPTIQRLGYLLHLMGMESHSLALVRELGKRKTKKIPLSLTHKKRTGDVEGKFGIIINTELDL